MNKKILIKDIATALNRDNSAVQRRSTKEAWPHTIGKGRGGNQKEFSFDTLPIDVQAALLRIQDNPAPAPQKPQYNQQSIWTHYEAATDKKKAVAQERTNYLIQLQNLIDTGATFKEASQVVAKVNGISAGSLKNWYFGANGRKGAKHYPREDWLAVMVPAHAGRQKYAELCPDAWAYFKADYLRLEQPTATACYERLKLAAESNGWTVCSLTTIERRIKDIPATTRVLLREGEHALMRLFPALERTVGQLHAMEWVNGDGYQHNVFCRFPDDHIGRPKTWFWQDVHSRKILAWFTDETENTDAIRLAFGKLVEKYGIPDHITIDNTRAAANKWMTGGVPNRYRFKVKEDDPIGLFPMLGIKVHWTSVIAGRGHGQAKPIERAFGVGGLEEYIDKHPSNAGAYTGANPMAKPENYGSKAIDIEDFKQTIAAGVAMFNEKLKRNTETCYGKLSFNQSFEKSYSKALVRKATEEQRRLWMLTAEAITVSRDGSITLQTGAARMGKNRYADDSLLEYRRQKVVVRFDPQELHEAVHVYTLDGRYIGEAECIQAAGFGDSQVGRKANRLRKQKIKASKAEAAAEQQLSALEAAALLPKGGDDSAVEQPKVIKPIFKKAAGSDITPTTEQTHAAAADAQILQLWNNKKQEDTL